MLQDSAWDKCSVFRSSLCPHFYAIANTVLPLVLSGEAGLVILPGKPLERKKLSSIKVSGLSWVYVERRRRR